MVEVEKEEVGRVEDTEVVMEAVRVEVEGWRW